MNINPNLNPNFITTPKMTSPKNITSGSDSESSDDNSVTIRLQGVVKKVQDGLSSPNQSKQISQDDYVFHIGEAEVSEGETELDETELQTDSISLEGLNAYDEEGLTPLLWAAQEGDIEGILALISVGVDLNLPNKEGDTPLMLVAGRGNIDCVQALIEANADLNIQNEIGSTALMLAVRGENISSVQVLIKAKADFNIQDKAGFTAFMHACWGRRPDTDTTIRNYYLPREQTNILKIEKERML